MKLRADRGLEKQGYHEYLEVLHMKLAIIGFVLMIVLMYVLIREKMAPPVAFILLPLIAAACAGFGMEDIAGFVKTGMKFHVKHRDPVRLFYLIFHIDVR